MSLIPDESYSFPDHFVQTVGRDRKVSRQPSVELPTEPTPAIAEARETEKQQQSARSRWWQFVGFRESPKAEEPAVVEEAIDTMPEPELQMSVPEPEPEPAMTATSDWVELEIPSEPIIAEEPMWEESFQEAAVEISPITAPEPEAIPVMNEMPIPMNISTEMPPPLQVEENLEPVIDQPAVVPSSIEPPSIEPEQTNSTSEEESGPRIFIPSLVPSTLKRKVRWNMRAAQTQENQLANPNTDFPSNGAPPESSAEPPLPPPIAQPPPKPRPEIEPKVSIVPPLPEPEPQLPPAVVPESPNTHANILPDEPGSRTVEAPSADLVQTLLARALFGSTEIAPAPAAPAAPKNHIVNFAPAPPPPKKPSNGHLPPPPALPKKVAPAVERKPKAEPVVERIVPVAVPESFDETVLTGRRFRSAKFRRFIKYEAIAVAVLIPLALLGLLRVFHNPAMILIVDVVTITAAIAATLMPILFFAVAPPLPRGEE